MKTSNAPQTAREALMVMREAFRDQAAVGVSSAGELVYVNPDRPGNTSIDVASPDEVRNVLTAKIENELARSHTSIEQLRTHIKKTLPSLGAVDFRADNPAIPLLLCEWEELLKQTDPVRSAEFQTDKRMMARREKLVDFLRKCLPAEGELTPLQNNHYEARISASVEQQQQMLGAFEVNQYRDIDTALNITKQLVKDSPRLNDLRVLMPARAEAKREVSHLKHAPANQSAAALQQLTRLRHTRQSPPDKSPADGIPQDQIDTADRNFMRTLSMMVDQTLLNDLDALQKSMLGNQPLIFNRDGDHRYRQLLIDNDGNPVLTITEERLASSFDAADISPFPLPLQSPPRGTPISSENATFSFRAAVTISKADAEQGRLRIRFIDAPELTIRFSLDWENIDPILAKKWS